MHYAGFFEDGYYLYFALRSISGGRIIFMLYSTQYIWGADTIYTMHYAVFCGVHTIYAVYYAVFLGVPYYLYYALRSIFAVWILLILYTTPCFWGADNIYTMHYAVFLVGGYYLYSALRSIFGGYILFILCTTRYFEGWILFILW